MIILYFLLFSFLQSQTQPSIGLNENNPRVWALTNALVHTEPGDSIKDCTIIIRDGKIDKVGRYIRIPLDAFELDMSGVSIYPGFIDSWYQIKRKITYENADDHWNKHISAHYRAKTDLNIKKKELDRLYSLGITAAHVVPEKGIIKGNSDLIVLDNNFNSLSKNIAQVIEFKTGSWSDRTYPNSLLGVIALLRQTFTDAQWYMQSNQIIEKFPEMNEPIFKNSSLESLLDNITNQKPVLFMTNEEHGVLLSLIHI